MTATHPVRKPRWVVIVAFENDRRRQFMVVRHKQRGWELPGGGINAGELPEDAAHREFREETGHDLGRAALRWRRTEPGHTGWIYEGRVGRPRPPAATVRHEQIVESRLVRSLDEVDPLSFPDDPYPEIGKRIGRRLDGAWA